MLAGSINLMIHYLDLLCAYIAIYLDDIAAWLIVVC